MLTAAARDGLVRLSETRCFLGGLSLVEGLVPGRPHRLRVLTYHRVDDAGARPDLYPGLISASPARFAAQMEHVGCHYRVVSMSEVLDAAEGKAPLPTRAVLITFDDAYRDFAEHAWPVMRRLGLPATLFVPTAFPDQPRHFWWDRLHRAVMCAERVPTLPAPLGPLGPLGDTAADRRQVLRRLLERVKSLPHTEAMALVDAVSDAAGRADPAGNSVLGWDDLRRLRTEGVTLAPHTRTHPLLNRLTGDEIEVEIRGSLDDLRERIGEIPPVLAYPAGGVDERAVSAVRSAGYALAFTTARGTNDLRVADRFRLRRINVGGRTTLGLLRAQLL